MENIYFYTIKSNGKPVWDGDRLIYKPRYAYHTTTTENASRILQYGMAIRPNEKTWFFFSTIGAKSYLTTHMSIHQPDAVTMALRIKTDQLSSKHISIDHLTNDDEPISREAFSFCSNRLIFIAPNSVSLYAALIDKKELRKQMKGL